MKDKDLETQIAACDQPVTDSHGKPVAATGCAPDHRGIRSGKFAFLAGSYPAGCSYVSRTIRALKRQLTDAVQTAHGEVSLLHAAAIQTICRHEGRAILCQRWLRETTNLEATQDAYQWALAENPDLAAAKHAEVFAWLKSRPECPHQVPSRLKTFCRYLSKGQVPAMTLAERLAYLREIGTASDSRDRVLRALELVGKSTTGDFWDSHYANQPALRNGAQQANGQPSGSTASESRQESAPIDAGRANGQVDGL